MYPADGTLTDSMTYAGRTVKRGKLSLQTDSTGLAQLSNVLRGSPSLLTASLAAKMNIIRGCDIPWYIQHHTGGHLGNFARNDGNSTDGQFMQGYPTPTIDQVMGWSPKFYTESDLSGIRQRALVVGSPISFNWSNPSNPQDHGPVQGVAGSLDALALFKQIFVNTGGTGMTNPNAALVSVADRVHADYLRLRNSNTRLSSDDRHRLDDHMQRMSELERKLNVRMSASCPTIAAVTTDTTKLQNMSTYAVDPALQKQVYQAFNQVIAAAIICDTSRVAVIDVRDHFSTYAGDWHQDVAHHAAEPDGAKEQTMVAAHQLTFANIFLDLCSKLDIDDGTGKTYLDNSLVVWTQESGEYTHSGCGMPIVTAGSAGGFLTTGNYCDYRNPAFVVDAGESGNTVKLFGGLLWQQWLGTALQAMGLDRADYEKNGLGGYPGPVKFIGPGLSKFYTDEVWNAAGDVLPFLKA